MYIRSTARLGDGEVKMYIRSTASSEAGWSQYIEARQLARRRGGQNVYKLDIGQGEPSYVDLILRFRSSKS